MDMSSLILKNRRKLISLVAIFQKGKLKELLGQQVVEQLEAVGIASLAIKDPQILNHKSPEFSIADIQVPQHPLHERDLVETVFCRLFRRDGPQNVKNAQEP